MCTDALPGGFPVFGDLGVGVLRDQFFYDVDFSLSKCFRISEQKSLQIRAEAFNVFNMQILGTPGADVTSGTLGVIHSIASTPRELQLGAKFVFLRGSAGWLSIAQPFTLWHGGLTPPCLGRWS